MRTRTTLAAAAVLAAGALLSWLAASGRLATALAQDKKADPAPAPTGGTPGVLPRSDFHFPGNVGRTYLDPDPQQLPPGRRVQPVSP
jgi:arylsulfatase